VSGAEALAEMEEQAPDAVILDLVMPGVGGLVVLEEMRRRDLAPGALILVLTAYEDGEALARCTALGAEAHISKPFDPEKLVAALKDRLVRRR
jgi:CheY-like chemotaxis protein